MVSDLWPLCSAFLFGFAAWVRRFLVDRVFMKLASLKSGRDGQLVVVSRDLSRAAEATDIAPTLQAALDEWEALEPELRRLSIQVNEGAVATFGFDPSGAAAPLPRAYQWAQGAAYVRQLELAHKARGTAMPAGFWDEPLLYQGGSDALCGPTDPISVAQADGWGVDFEAGVGVVLDDTPMGVAPTQARKHIKLITLVNDVSLRGLVPGETAKGFGFFQSKPATSFAPVAVTPDEMGVSWDGGAVHLPLLCRVNGLEFGAANPAVDMTFDFPSLVSHACKTRNLGAGTIIGSGGVSNGYNGGPGRSITEGGVGYSSIGEVRALETLDGGGAKTPYLAYGDRVEIEMRDPQGRSIFGKIDQTVQRCDVM